MALTTSGLKKRVKKRLPDGGAGGKVGGLAKKGPGVKRMPAPKVGKGYGTGGTMGKGKPPGGSVGGTAGKARPKITRPVVGGATGTVREGSKRKPVTNVRPVVGGATKPGAGNRRAIAAKKKVFAAKRANKLANQKKLAARKRGAARRKKV